MTYYTQLREFERVEIYRGPSAGLTLEMIGRKLGRSKSTISRELARNSDHIGSLYPRDAQKRTDDRKARHGYKLDRNSATKAYNPREACSWMGTRCDCRQMELGAFKSGNLRRDDLSVCLPSKKP